MPPKTGPRNVSHQEAFDAIRVLSTLASAIPAQGTTITYGTNTANGQVPMTPDNSPPALAVWLFLVTSMDFLSALDDPTDITTVPVSTISSATNLSTTSVNQILDIYRRKQATQPIPGNTATLKQCFQAVISQFQDFAGNAGYGQGECPGGPNPIIKLAQQGAAVTTA